MREPQTDSSTLMASATEHCRSQRCERAIGLSEAAAQLEPANSALQYYLGICYSGGCRQHSLVDLQVAHVHLGSALSLLGAAAAPLYRANILAALGNTYPASRHMHVKARLKAAIECHEQAAFIFHSEGRLDDWAREEFNLGNAFSELPEECALNKWQDAIRHPARQEYSHRRPVFLPDGNHYLFLAANFSGHPEVNAIFLGSLDSSQRRLIVQASANPAYVAPGYLLFYQDRVLTAQPFDLQRMALAGKPVTVLNDVQFLPQVDRAIFAASGSGPLFWQSSSRAVNTQLVWFDRHGKQLGTVGKPAIYGNVRLAPDARRVASDITDLESTSTRVWTLDLSRETAKRFTFDPGFDYVPIWSPDGRRLLFGSNRSQRLDLFVKNSDGSGEDKALLHEGGSDVPSDWSRDGKYILYSHGSELWYLALPGLQTKPFLQTQAVLANGQFSPDGHWVAYASNETGRWEIYVTSFPEPRGKWQVSASGGQEPRWRGDGRELFYLDPDAVMMAVPVNLGAGFDAGRPTALFQAHPHPPILSVDLFTYDVTADGQRFLVNTRTGQTGTAPLSVQLNWSLELKK